MNCSKKHTPTCINAQEKSAKNGLGYNGKRWAVGGDGERQLLRRMTEGVGDGFFIEGGDIDRKKQGLGLLLEGVGLLQDLAAIVEGGLDQEDSLWLISAAAEGNVDGVEGDSGA